MLIIPAIDLKAGKCVCLAQGKMKKMTVFSTEPVSIARFWYAKGAKLLHVIDLEGAFVGAPCNLNIVTKIVRAVNIPIQLGGGIRDIKTIKKVLSKGVDRVVLGTAVYNNIDLVKRAQDKFKEKIVIGIDSFDGKIALEGWKKIVDKDDIAFAKEIETLGIKIFIFTDIRKDGMLKGPNFEKIKEFGQNIKTSFIISGGISSIEDVKEIKKLGFSYNIIGMIIGKAIYTGNIELDEAISLVEVK